MDTVSENRTICSEARRVASALQYGAVDTASGNRIIWSEAREFRLMSEN